jgi:protein TonB
MVMQHYVSNSVIQGTLYLKQAYQKNMLIALLLGISLHLAAIGAYTVVTHSAAAPVLTGIRSPLDSFIVVLPPPPPVGPDEPINGIVVEPGEFPEFFTPEPIDDWPAGDSVVLLTKSEKHMIAQHYEPGESSTPGRIVYVPPEIRDDLPGITEFTYAEEYPEAIHLASPRYPEMARKAGLRASLIVRALIDVNGDVIDARVISVTTEGVGFEETALEAAYKCKWTPALQSNQPVPCWVSYTVAFELH